jgi:hypothetical protein
MQTISRQMVGKHVPDATTIELLLETIFSTWSVHSGYKEGSLGDPVSCQFSGERVEFCTGGCEVRI